MKFRLGLVVIFVLMAIFCSAKHSSRNWAMGPRLYAWSTAFAGLGLTGAFLARQLRRTWKSGGEAISDAEVGTKMEIVNPTKFFGWVVALAAAIWLLGFEVSIFLFVLSYIKLHRGSWLLSISVAMLVALIAWGLFDKLLNLAWVSGVVPQRMGFSDWWRN